MNDKLPTPKRGAFPTPKDVLDKARKYTPEAPTTADDSPIDEMGRSTDRQPHQDDPGAQKDRDEDSKQK